MEFLIPLLIILSILLVSITLIGHGIWVALAWLFRKLSGTASANSITLAPSPQGPRPCVSCRSLIDVQMKYCGRCGAIRLTLAQEEQLRELVSTLRQLERLHQAGALDELNLRVLKTKIDSEREQLLFPHGRPGAARQPSLFIPDLRTSGVAPPIKPVPPPAIAIGVCPNLCSRARPITGKRFPTCRLAAEGSKPMYAVNFSFASTSRNSGVAS